MGYIVRTLVDGVEVDTQTVNDQTELKDNSFVTFNQEQALEVNGGDVFSGGTNGTSDGSAHQKAREAFEAYSFNILAVPSTDQEVQDAYIEYVKRMRDEYGVKFQIVIPAISREKGVNYEGVIECASKVLDPIGDAQSDLVYWLAGAEAGCKVQSSCTNKIYNGRFTVDSRVTRSQQRSAIKNGQILFHNDGDDVVILKDLNTLTSVERDDEKRKNIQFSSNQVVRVFDGISTESAAVFNKFFLGKRNNNATERADLRNRLLKIRERYAQINAIDTYDQSLLTLMPGPKPNEVIGTDGIRPLQAMEILYFTIQYLDTEMV